MLSIDPSYLRAAGLESDPVIAVVSTLLSGAVLIGVLIPLLLKHFRFTPSCPRLSAIVGYPDRRRSIMQNSGMPEFWRHPRLCLD